MADYLERADWRHHTAEHGAVRMREAATGNVFTMEFLPSPGDTRFLWRPLYEMWRGLPSMGLIPDLVGTADRDTVLLRYAAIDWLQQPQLIEDLGAAARTATWGVQLTRVFELILAAVPGDLRGWFACPLMKIDIAGRPRVMFLSPATSAAAMQRLPPEVLVHWPACDERGLVYVIGQLLLGVIAGKRPARTPLGTVILRCLERAPENRFPTLHALRDALAICGGERNEREPLFRHTIWDDIDEAYGAIARWQWDAALGAAERALDKDPRNEPALLARAHAEANGGVRLARVALFMAAQVRERHFEGPSTRRPPRTQPWETTHPTIEVLLRERSFRDALDLCERTIAEGAALVTLHVHTARCHLELNELGAANELARKALAVDPQCAGAFAVACAAHQRKREFGEALALADRWAALRPDDANAHHARGKALFGQRLLAQARDAFERAMTLDPMLVAALYFRREVDIAMKHVRDQVGVDEAMPAPAVPDHLADVRDALLAGSTSDAIAVLRSAEHAEDPVAQLVLANLLQGEHAFAEAIELYASVAARWPEHARAANAASALCKAALPPRAD